MLASDMFTVIGITSDNCVAFVCLLNVSLFVNTVLVFTAVEYIVCE